MSTQYIDAVLRLVDKFTGPMNNAMGKLERSSKSLKSLGREVQKVGTSITSVGTGITTAVTLPVAAFGSVAVKQFGETDKTLRLVQQTMGSTGAEAKELRKRMQDAAANSVFGMQDAADATLNFARQGWSAKEAGDMLAPSLNLAAGTATDLSTVTEGLGSALKAFGEDTKNAEKYTDILSVAQGQANTTVTELLDSLSRGGAAVKTVGWDIKDLSAATGVLGDAMISGSEAGNAFKTGVARLADPAKAGKEALEKLGVELFDGEGKMKSFTEVQGTLHNAFADLSEQEQIAAASAIFGKNQYSKWLTLIQRSPEDIQGMITEMDEAENKSKSMADALLSGVGGSLEKLKSSFDVVKDDLGGIIGEVVKPVIDHVTEMIDAFRQLPEGTKKNIVKVVGIIAAMGPALLIFGKLTTGVGKIISIFGKLGGAISKAGGLIPLLTSPAGIVIAVLAGIAVATILVIKNWDKIKATAQKVFGYVKGVFSDLGMDTSKFKESFGLLKESVSNAINAIKASLGPLVPVFQKVAAFLWEGFKVKFEITFNIISGVVSAAVQAISGVLAGAMRYLSGVIDFVTGVFTGDWKRAWEGVKNIFGGIFDSLVALVKYPMNAVIGIINGAINGINRIGFTIPDWVPSLGGQVFKVDVPTIPMLAKGTSYFGGGLAMINEHGGEIVDLPKGSRVYPAAESKRMMEHRGSVTINIPKLADTISVRNDGDIDRIAAAIVHKLEKAYPDAVPV